MLSNDLKKILKCEVRDDEETIKKYSRDYSIFEIKPEAVVFPEGSEDIKRLVKFATKKRPKKEKGISLTARSAGTDMTGGPLTDSVVVEFVKNMNRIKEVGSNYAVVEPGVYFRDFEKEIQKRGLIYPPYPASKDICALGGMISNNSGGERTLAYGKTEDYVQELKAVLSDGEEYVLRPMSKKELQEQMDEDDFLGEIYRKLYHLLEENFDLIHHARPDVSKNSAGYYLWNVWDKNTFDITKLIVGSQGTLGLVTEAKLKLIPKKKFSRLGVVFLNDLKNVGEAVNRILRFRPETLESYDDKTLKLALRFFPGIVKAMKANAFKLFLSFAPEALMVLKGGLPKLVMLAEFTADDSNELETRVREFESEIRNFGLSVRIAKDEAEAEKYWTIRRQSFRLLHEHSKGKVTAPFIDDMIVKPEHLPEFLPKLDTILKKYGSQMVYTIAGHPGDGNFHIIPLMDLSKKESRDLIPKLSDEVYDLVLEYRGSITAEHNDGLIRTPYLEKMYGKEVVKLFEEVKNIFDPLNIFNPGKKVGGDLNYALEHIKKD